MFIAVLFEIYFFIDTLRYMHVVVYWCHSKIRRTQKTSSSCSCSKFLILIRNVQIEEEEEEVLLGRLSLSEI